jgi:TetR/AcrR family transcriptional regulator, transcriptional repressor for nem operon
MRMARTSRADKARTRQRILAKASQAFRKNGVSSVSIPALMASVGLTHGTFYAHFGSKDALVVETYAGGIDEVVDGLLQPAERAPQRDKVNAVLDTYLTAEHRDNPAGGCFFPTMTADVRRESSAAQREFSNALKRYFTRLATIMPKPGRTGHEDSELVLASGMVGAILLARAVDDSALGDRILSACRTFYSATLANPQPLPAKSRVRK